MADIHIREKDRQDKTVNCIFHFAVPATLNAAGLPWNEVLQKAKSPTPLMSYNDSTENAQIEAGNIYEHQETVRFSTINLTNEQRIAEVQTAYQDRQNTVFGALAGELDFFGTVINVGV